MKPGKKTVKKKTVISHILNSVNGKIPEHYYNKLDRKDKMKQITEIQKSRKLYRQKKYYTRPKMSSYQNKKSKHEIDFQKCYGIKLGNNLKEISKATGVPIPALQKILSKGRGAYYSSGSRPNQTAESWARARLASALLKRGAYKIDKHILDSHHVKNIKKCNVPHKK